MGEPQKLDENYTRISRDVLKNPGSNTPQNRSYMATLLFFQNPSQKDEQVMRDTAGEARTNS